MKTLVIKNGYIYQSPEETERLKSVYGKDYRPPRPLAVSESIVMAKTGLDCAGDWHPNPKSKPLSPASTSAGFSKKALKQIEALREHGKQSLSVDGDRVYFILSEITRRIKIGTTCSLHRRIKGLQTQSAEELFFLGSIAGDASLEAKIHDHARYKRAKHEWFYADDELINCIFEVVIGDSVDPIRTKPQVTRRHYQPPAGQVALQF